MIKSIAVSHLILIVGIINTAICLLVVFICHGRLKIIFINLFVEGNQHFDMSLKGVHPTTKGINRSQMLFRDHRSSESHSLYMISRGSQSLPNSVISQKMSVEESRVITQV